MLFAASRRGTVLTMPRPLSRCQNKAEIKSYLKPERQGLGTIMRAWGWFAVKFSKWRPHHVNILGELFVRLLIILCWMNEWIYYPVFLLNIYKTFTFQKYLIKCGHKIRLLLQTLICDPKRLWNKKYISYTRYILTICSLIGLLDSEVEPFAPIIFFFSAFLSKPERFLLDESAWAMSFCKSWVFFSLSFFLASIFFSSARSISSSSTSSAVRLDSRLSCSFLRLSWSAS